MTKDGVPPPERPGTPQADIYAIGKLLYVISTGRRADEFCDLSETLVQSEAWAELSGLNTIFCCACNLDLSLRYATATAMLTDLQALDAAAAANRQ